MSIGQMTLTNDSCLAFLPAGQIFRKYLDAQPNAHGGFLLDGMFCWINTPISSHLLCLDFVRRARPLRRRHDLRAV